MNQATVKLATRASARGCVASSPTRDKLRIGCQHVSRTARGIGIESTSVASCSEPGLTAVTSEPFNGLFRTVKANHVFLLTT